MQKDDLIHTKHIITFTDRCFLSESFAAFHTWMIAEADITTSSGAVLRVISNEWGLDAPRDGHTRWMVMILLGLFAARVRWRDCGVEAVRC